MRKDTSLIKEFKESDVNRLRNLLTKKYGDATKTQVGYVSIDENRNEGDVWEEEGRVYTISNGIKISSSKLSRIRSKILKPSYCPECSKIINREIDSKMIVIHDKCFDCVLQYETKLKLEGKYEEYEASLMKNKAVHMIDDFIDGLDNVLDEYMSGGFVTEQGDIEKWGENKIDKDAIKEQWTKIAEESKKNLLT